jgi:hypothetical protein
MNPVISNQQKGLCFSSNSTQNAMFALIDGVFGVPFVIDDIITNPNINLSQFIYSLAEGSPKNRLDGDCKLRDGWLGWSGVAITSSETCILDYGAQYQGLKARVIHTQGIQWTKDAAEAELVKRTVRKNFGFTGKDFALFVANKDFDDLCDRFDNSLELVKDIMVKKDNLTDRLASKYAAIYLTVELLNEAFGYNLSPYTLLERLIRCEQEFFEERDNARNAYNHIIDFITRYKSHFIIERKYSNPYYNYENISRPTDIYGKIIESDNLWEVHLLQGLTKKVLTDNGLGGEIRGIRKKWIESGITVGDSDHNTKQFTYTGNKARYDCFRIKGGIQEPESSEVVEKEPEVKQETPISNYSVDDSEEIKKIFGGNDNDRN